LRRITAKPKPLQFVKKFIRKRDQRAFHRHSIVA
jgi:hypothetical protein